MRKINLLLIGLGISMVTFGQDVVDNKFGKGFYNVVAKDSSYTMKFAARMQGLYVANWDVNDSAGLQPGNTQFLMRRARLKFGGFVFNPRVVYKIELGLTNKDQGKVGSDNNQAPKTILDAVVKWNFYKNLTLWAGQTKLPGNRERVVSSANMQLVDRSLLNKRFNIDRDMGAQLRHHFKIGGMVVKEMVAMSQGEGRNIVQSNLGGYQWTSRIEFLPFGKFKSKGDYSEADLKREDTPKLAVGITYDLHDRAVKDRSNMGSYMLNDAGVYETNIYTVFVDAMFKYKGMSLMFEYADRDADDPIAKNTDGTETGDVVKIGSGINTQLGYLFKNNWEIAGRHTMIELDKDVTGADIETQYTFGVSKYFVGHKLKVQSDISYLTVENDPDAGLMYRMQFDVHF